MTELDLAARIARLEAIEAIKQLKARYFEHCDRNYEYEAITALFARDGGFEAGKFGSHLRQPKQGCVADISDDIVRSTRREGHCVH